MSDHDHAKEHELDVPYAMIYDDGSATGEHLDISEVGINNGSGVGLGASAALCRKGYTLHLFDQPGYQGQQVSLNSTPIFGWAAPADDGIYLKWTYFPSYWNDVTKSAYVSQGG
jgi:hypothetical protein